MVDKKAIIEKINKILALAENNPSMEEAASAALKAQKLMAEYHIDEKELGTEVNERNIETVCCEVGGKTQKWKIQLGIMLAKNFRCRCVLYNTEVAFYGYEEDVAICREVFYSMYKIGVKLSDKLKREMRKENGTAKGVRNTFCVGFVDGIKSELEKQCTALMIVVPKEVNESYDLTFKKAKKVKAGLTISNNRSIYDKGYQSGKDAIRSRGIEAAY